MMSANTLPLGFAAAAQQKLNHMISRLSVLHPYVCVTLHVGRDMIHPFEERTEFKPPKSSVFQMVPFATIK